MPSITRRQSVQCYTFRNEILMSTKGILIKIYDRNIINEDNSICHGDLFWGEHGAGGDFCGSWYQRQGSSQSILCSALSNQFLCRRPEIIQCLRLHTFYRSKEKSERNLIEKYCYKLFLMRWDHWYLIGQLNYLSKHYYKSKSIFWINNLNIFQNTASN